MTSQNGSKQLVSNIHDDICDGTAQTEITPQLTVQGDVTYHLFVYNTLNISLILNMGRKTIALVHNFIYKN